MTKIISFSLGFGLEEKLAEAGHTESRDIANLARQLLKAHLDSPSSNSPTKTAIQPTVKPKKKVYKNFCPSCRRKFDPLKELDKIELKQGELVCGKCQTLLTYPEN